MSPERIQLKRTKGWRMPAETVKVTRPGPWGNPFVVGRDGTAEECVAKFAASILPYRHGGSLTDYLISEVTLDEIQRDLGGKNLACWCPEGAPCHADVLLRLANPDLPRPHPQEDKP